MDGMISRKGVPPRLRKHTFNEVDVHPALRPARVDAVSLGVAVGRMVLAHDAVEVAVVRVGIEGDAPRTRPLLGLSSCIVRQLGAPPSTKLS